MSLWMQSSPIKDLKRKKNRKTCAELGQRYCYSTFPHFLWPQGPIEINAQHSLSSSKWYFIHVCELKTKKHNLKETLTQKSVSNKHENALYAFNMSRYPNVTFFWPLHWKLWFLKKNTSLYKYEVSSSSNETMWIKQGCLQLEKKLFLMISAHKHRRCRHIFCFALAMGGRQRRTLKWRWSC
jgi:hypothetical protein